MAIKKMRYSFLKGMQKVTREEFKPLQDKLYNIMGCSSWQEYYRKRKSYSNIPAHIKESIDKAFEECGISPDDIWDIF